MSAAEGRCAAPVARVASSLNYANVQTNATCWQADVADAADPIIVLAPAAIDADRMKYLYLSLAVEYAGSLQVFFGADQPFNEPQSFRVHDLPFGLTKTNLLLDLTEIPQWHGAVNNLRLDLEGCEQGGRVRLYAVGAYAQPDTAPDAAVVKVSAAAAMRVPSERMAAYHHTLVMADEKSLGSVVMTYGLDKPASHYLYVVARFFPLLDARATNNPAPPRVRPRVADAPGSVVAEYNQDDVAVRYELLPLLIGRDTSAWDGAVLYRITTQPPTPITVLVGEGRLHQPGHPMPFLADATLKDSQDTVRMTGATALVRGPQHPFTVAVRSSGAMRIAGATNNQHLAVRFAQGSGTIMVGFAPHDRRAMRGVASAPEAAYGAVTAHYARLLNNYIVTPEPVLDTAFRSAIYNLEYAWIEPLGWIESIHHWHLLWHMQAAGAMPWLGLTARARQCLFAHADRVLPNGAAPQLTAAGDVHREIFTGGSSQFYAWQMQQYWNYAANTNDLPRMGRVLDQVVRQVYEEYDPDNDLLLKWAAQIANQEDFVMTPYNGTSPSIEGIAMMKTARQLAAARGDHAQARYYTERIARATARLREELWQPQLGRFMYFKDPLGVARPEGQYHTLILPVLHGLLDPLDSYTSIRHMRDRLMTSDGAICCGNNFPAHGATSGCQIGAAQQPWGARGLAAVGLRNEACKPLRAVAAWVMSPTLRGAWPEIAADYIAAYFSPPAGLYIQTVIEALFGLQLRAQEHTVLLTPSFPDAWPAAVLHVADFSATYTRTGNVFHYEVISTAPLRRSLRWLLPPGDVTAVRVNGAAVPFVTTPAVGCVELRVDTPATTRTDFQIELQPWQGGITYPASIAEGAAFSVGVADATILRSDDRAGVLASSAQPATTALWCRVAGDLLKPYRGFGRLGQLNFSRRTFFVLCATAAGAQFWLPIDLAIVPRYEACQQGSLRVDTHAVTLALRMRNNTHMPLTNVMTVRVARQSIPVTAAIPARSERVLDVALPLHTLALLSPGDNHAELLLDDATCLDMVVNASAAYAHAPRLAADAAARMQPLRLPPALLKSHAQLAGVRDSYGADWTAWAQWAPRADQPPGTAMISVPGLPVVTFTNCDNKVMPISWKSGTPMVTLNLKNKTYRKLYLLVQPWLENHDQFTPVARLCIRTPARDYVARVLSTPGDFDYGYPAHAILSTYTGPRPDRHGLLPLLRECDGDWAEGKPPAFPQPEFWADTLCVKTDKGLMNVIELDFDMPVSIATLTIESIGTDPAFGIVGVTGELAGDGDRSFMPPPALQDPLTIVAVHNADSVKDWTFEGDAFSVAAQPDLFDGVSLNSRVKHGEQAVGKAISPPFRIPPGYTRLQLICQGTAGMPGALNPTLYFDLVDATSGVTLIRHCVQGTHHLAAFYVPVGQFAGRTVRLAMVDANNGAACAWLGLRKATLLTN